MKVGSSSLAHPEALALAIPLMIFFYFLYKKHKSPSVLFSEVKRLESLPESLRSKWIHFPLFLKFLSFLFMILALARPQQVTQKSFRNVEGIHIMMVLDISESMLVEDMEPRNRLLASKKVIQDFIKGRHSDRIGLIVFSGESYTRVPLTLDYDILIGSLEEVQVDTHIEGGTAIGVALANAVARLKDVESKSKVVILVTDGESNTGSIDPETALGIARDHKVKVYTVAIGRKGQGKLPFHTRDIFGNKVKTYRILKNSVNTELLEKISRETGGKSFHVSGYLELEKVFKEVDALEKVDIRSDEYTQYEELFQKPLFLALALFLIASLLGQTVFRVNP